MQCAAYKANVDRNGDQLRLSVAGLLLVLRRVWWYKLPFAAIRLVLGTTSLALY